MNQNLNIENENEYFKECGKIFLTFKGSLIFYCTLCENKFQGFQDFAQHTTENHYIDCKKEDSFIEAGYLIKSEVEENERNNIKGTSDSNGLQTSKPNTPENTSNVLEENEMDIRKLITPTKSKSPTFDKSIEIEKKNLSTLAKVKKRYKSKEPPVCPVCKEVLSRNTHLKTHMRRHSDVKPHKCSTCSKAFFTRCELDTHIRSHTGERPYLCTECGEAFTTSSKLNAHIKQRHKKQRDQVCKICSLSFYTRYALKNHLTTHSEIRPFNCTLCKSSFKRRNGLLSHMKMHKNEKEFGCDMCSARFNQKCNLNSHRKNKHSLVCDIKEVFSTSSVNLL